MRAAFAVLLVLALPSCIDLGAQVGLLQQKEVLVALKADCEEAHHELARALQVACKGSEAERVALAQHYTAVRDQAGADLDQAQRQLAESDLEQSERIATHGALPARGDVKRLAARRSLFEALRLAVMPAQPSSRPSGASQQIGR